MQHARTLSWVARMNVAQNAIHDAHMKGNLGKFERAQDVFMHAHERFKEELRRDCYINLAREVVGWKPKR